MSYLYYRPKHQLSGLRILKNWSRVLHVEEALASSTRSIATKFVGFGSSFSVSMKLNLEVPELLMHFCTHTLH